jgi:diacylglycerol kinase (ATP)
LKEYTFIVNPEAGRGHARSLLDPLRTELDARGVDHEILVTTRQGQARDFARNGAGPVVVAVGGDGTLNEVANGVTERQRALGIIPAGSGNDFIKTLKYPRRLSSALDIILAGKIRKVDAGVITCKALKPGSGTVETLNRVFVNGVGVGFDAAVAARMRTIRYLSGTAVYVLAVLKTLGKYKAPDFRIVVDGTEIRSRNLLIAVGNGRCAGGSFYLTPDAEVDDGCLDLCLIKEVSIPKILRLMPLVMVGKHKGIKEVSFSRSREQILIDSDSTFHVHADGELVGEQVNHVEITTRPEFLSILVGA